MFEPRHIGLLPLLDSALPIMKKFSGDVLYVENRSPVTRADDQIEDVKLIIEF